MSSIPFFLCFLAIVVIYATWRGGGPERLTAIAYVLALLASASGGFLHVPGQFRFVPLYLFLVDSAMLIGLCAIALRANRLWPIPNAACQLVLVMTHVARLSDLSMFPTGYAFLTKILPWPMVALLALATWAHRRRLGQRIIVPDWKPSLSRRRSRMQPAPLSD